MTPPAIAPLLTPCVEAKAVVEANELTVAGAAAVEDAAAAAAGTAEDELAGRVDSVGAAVAEVRAALIEVAVVWLDDKV